MIEREDLEATLGHLNLPALSPSELTHLIRSAVSALATAVANVAPLAPLSRRLAMRPPRICGENSPCCSSTSTRTCASPPRACWPPPEAAPRRTCSWSSSGASGRA